MVRMPQDTAPYGPPENPLLWQYTPSSELDGLISAGRFATYSGGGYVIDLPTNSTLAQATVQVRDFSVAATRPRHLAALPRRHRPLVSPRFPC